jgi:threonylcarbamoyladenosine tRNA methylthiotransferase MtaB
VQEIIAEVERICANYKEIVLCGINIGLYGKDLKGTYDLADLVAEILAIKSLGRLRLSSLEPRTVNDKLIELFHHEKLCPHVHFPFQSGDNTILKRMNKKDTIESYREIASRFRKIHSDIALGCDIIISFPGEAEANFQNTFRFLEELRPMRIHIFPFSPRENTPLSKIKPDAYLARKRSAILKELAQRFSLEYRSSFLGKTLAMITEEQKNDYVFGYTQNYIKVQTSAAAKLGEILPVKVVKIEEEKTFAVLA